MRRLLPVLIALLFAAAGCGGDDSGGATKDNQAGQKGPSSTNGGGGGASPDNAADGRTIFASTCGSCHTLKAAETSGTFGPNLDELKPSKAVVLNQIDHGGGGMP